MSTTGEFKLRELGYVKRKLNTIISNEIEWWTKGEKAILFDLKNYSVSFSDNTFNGFDLAEIKTAYIRLEEITTGYDNEFNDWLIEREYDIESI